MTLIVTTDVLLYEGARVGFIEGATVGLTVGAGVGVPSINVLVVVIAKEPTDTELLVDSKVATALLAIEAMVAA